MDNLGGYQPNLLDKGLNVCIALAQASEHRLLSNRSKIFLEKDVQTSRAYGSSI